MDLISLLVTIRNGVVLTTPAVRLFPISNITRPISRSGYLDGRSLLYVSEVFSTSPLGQNIVSYQVEETLEEIAQENQGFVLVSAYKKNGRNLPHNVGKVTYDILIPKELIVQSITSSTTTGRSLIGVSEYGESTVAIYEIEGTPESLESTISAPTGGLPNYYIPAGESIYIPPNKQHVVYGNLVVEGLLKVDGELIIQNGALDMSGGGTVDLSGGGTIRYVNVFVGSSSTDSGMKLLKVTKTFEDWQPNAGSSGTITLAELPAGSVVSVVKVKPTESFQDDSTPFSFLTLVVKYIINGNTFNFGSATDMLTVGDTNGGIGTGGDTGADIPSHAGTTELKGLLATGGEEDPALNAMTQGSVTVWIWYMVGL